jgi:hypothetical protein
VSPEDKKDFVENASIMKTHLGYEDHGLPTAYLTLELSTGGVQAFGGLNLTSDDEMKKFVTGVLNAVGVSSWEELPGRPVRVKHAGGPLGNIIGVGNIMKEKWYIPEEWLEEKSSW